MNILSLDLSTKSSGIAVAENNKLIYYECVASASTDVVKRIIVMRNRISEIIKEYNIDEIVIEEVRTDYNNSHTFRILNWVQAAIVLAAYDINSKIKITYLQASSWRSKIGIKTGRGIKRETLKQEDIKYVKEKFNISANDDICDAICLLDAYVGGELYNENSDNEMQNWG